MTAARRALLSLEVPLGSLGALAVVLGAVFAVTGIPSWIPTAPVVHLGVASPTTGMTRSFVALVSGDPARAFVLHPLGPLAFAACIAMPAIAVASWIRGARFVVVSRLLHSTAAWLCVGAVLAAAWVRQIVVMR